MVEIKVTRGGVGVVETDAAGKNRYICKTAADGPFFVAAERAAELVRLGVAQYSPFFDPSERAAEDVSRVEMATGAGPIEIDGAGHLDPDQLEGMTYAELKKLAADIGAKPTGSKKADLIAAIMAVEIAVEAVADYTDLAAAEPD